MIQYWRYLALPLWFAVEWVFWKRKKKLFTALAVLGVLLAVEFLIIRRIREWTSKKS